MKPVAGCSIISSFLFSLQKRSGSESGKGRLLSYGSGDLLSRFFSACRLCPTRPREACSCFYLLSPGQSFRVDPALPLRSSDLGVGRPAGGSSDLDRSGLDLAYLSLLTSLSPSVHRERPRRFPGSQIANACSDRRVQSPPFGDMALNKSFSSAQ